MKNTTKKYSVYIMGFQIDGGKQGVVNQCTLQERPSPFRGWRKQKSSLRRYKKHLSIWYMSDS